MIRYLLAFAALCCASPAIAHENFVRVEAGAALGHPDHRDFDRAPKNFTSRVTTPHDTTAFGAAVGRHYDGFTVEVSANYVEFDAGRAGCIRCGPPTPQNGYAYTPDKQIGQTKAIPIFANLTLDQRVGPVILSAGGGAGTAYYEVETGAQAKRGWKSRSDSWKFAYQATAGLRIPVSKHVEVGARYAYQNLGKRSVDFTSQGGTVLANARQTIDYHVVTGTLGFRW